MRAFVGLVMQPFIHIGLKHVDALVEFLADRDLIEFLQDGLMEPLAHTVDLR